MKTINATTQLTIKISSVVVNPCWKKS